MFKGCNKSRFVSQIIFILRPLISLTNLHKKKDQQFMEEMKALIIFDHEIINNIEEESDQMNDDDQDDEALDFLLDERNEFHQLE